MRFFIVFLFLVSELYGQDLSFTATAKELKDPKNTKTFFDPHNHTGGILSVEAAINPKKFIAGEELSVGDLKDFWFKLVRYFHESSLKKDRQVSNGTKLIINCNEPKQYCQYEDMIDGENPQEGALQDCKESLLDSIYNVLTATPLTSFATAYRLRGTMPQIPDLWGRSSSYVQARAKILEIAKTGAGLIELSKAFIGGYKDDSSVFEFQRYKEIVDDLNSPSTSVENKALKDRMVELGLKVPMFKWLLLTHTLEFGQTSETRTMSYNVGQCVGIDFPPNLATNPKSGLYQTLVNFEDVVGVDVAGPEITCFSSHGMMTKLRDLVLTTYEASKERRLNNIKPSKLVVRIHVGEGSPLLETPYKENESEACELAKSFPKAMKTRADDVGEPVHQKESRVNISRILWEIERIKSEINDVDDFVVFRLGHMTHATKEQAELTKKLGITTDVNLSSNIATQALTVAPALIDEYLVKKGITANKVRDLLSVLQEQGAPIGKIFEGHGLKWLLYYGVPTTLGTDGAGVEHVPSLAREYELAEKLIEYWNANDSDFASRGISIDTLLHNQQKHYQSMGY